MLGPEAAAKAVAALAALAFALVVAHPRDRSRSGVSLAVFLGLIGANQALEAARAAGIGPDEGLARAAAVVAALDPVALLVFAGTLPAARAVRTRTLVAVLAVAAAFALAGGWGVPSSPRALQIYATGLSLYTLVVYSTALANAARASGERAELRALVLAMAIAAIPLGPRAVDSTVGAILLGYHGGWRLFGTLLSLGGGALAVALHIAWGRRAGAPLRALSTGAGIAALFMTYHVAEGLTSLGVAAPVEPLAALGRAGAALRWMLFAALASIAVLREDVLGFGLAARRRAARVLLATGAVALLTITLSLIEAVSGSRIRPLDVAILVVLVGATQGSRALIDSIATRAYALPAASTLAAEERYREAAARVLAKGDDPGTSEALARLRAELGLGTAAARALHRSAEEAVPSPLVVGALVAGRYRVLEDVSRAGSGRSLRARDELMLRDVVLRVAPAHARAGPIEAARLASAAQHHNLVTVFNVIPRADATLLVQEATQGGSLDQAGALAPEAASAILEGVLRGLAELHASGIAHGDLREANVLLAADATPKLVDFGLVPGTREDDVRDFARLARRLAPDERAHLVERALAGGFADARALLLAWRAGAR